MKGKYGLVMSVTGVIVFVSCILYSQGGTVERHNFFIVPYNWGEVLDVEVGDMVQCNTRNLPLTQHTMNATFKTEYDTKYLSLIGQTPPDREGPMSREVYVKTLKPGQTQLKIVVVNDNDPVEEFLFSLRIK